jgi:hypothetical protein
MGGVWVYYTEREREREIERERARTIGARAMSKADKCV